MITKLSLFLICFNTYELDTILSLYKNLRSITKSASYLLSNFLGIKLEILKDSLGCNVRYF